ncbi:MAG TPA: peptide ligase PGM1-related protein, partial [Propionibacteriaceae bacterium]|nr:peptide ligase PGM1-related protein [Propionibacteriaceae bacterium]
SRLISGPAMIIGKRLAREGALGRFALDFVVVRGADDNWSPYAIEINLRKGGTTHPFLTLQFLTDGGYDGDSGRFLTPDGNEKHLVATDHLEADELRALSVGDLFDVVARHGLHFDQSRQVGIVFHMISSLSEFGRIGMTAVGDTPDHAMELYRQAESVMLEEAAAARRERTLPT